MERDKIKADYDKVIDEIKDLLDILDKESRVLDIIKTDLLKLKRIMQPQEGAQYFLMKGK